MLTADSYRTALLGLARGALVARVAEAPPGSHRGPKVDVYAAGCVRGGKFLGLRGVPWCASFASWCAWQAWAAANGAPTYAAPHLPYELSILRWPYTDTAVAVPPIGYRAAVSELVADARACGAWHEVDAYEPLPGDLCIMGRGGEDPRRGGEGHVAVVDEASDVDAWCIGGNEEHAVCRTLRSTRTLDVPEPVVGFVAMGAGL